jgi:hypothetical protein
MLQKRRLDTMRNDVNRDFDQSEVKIALTQACMLVATRWRDLLCGQRLNSLLGYMICL